MGKLSFNLNIDKVETSQIQTVKDAVDAQILEWNTEYPNLSFSTDSFLSMD